MFPPSEMQQTAESDASRLCDCSIFGSPAACGLRSPPDDDDCHGGPLWQFLTAGYPGISGILGLPGEHACEVPGVHCARAPEAATGVGMHVVVH